MQFRSELFQRVKPGSEATVTQIYDVYRTSAGHIEGENEDIAEILKRDAAVLEKSPNRSSLMQRIVSFSTLNPSLIASTRSLVIPNFSRSSENEIQGEFVDSTIQLLQIRLDQRLQAVDVGSISLARKLSTPTPESPSSTSHSIPKLGLSFKISFPSDG